MNNISYRKNPLKAILLSILMVISIGVGSATLNADQYSIKVIVIDAGHGGADPGCKGSKHINEKKLTLDIALKLGKLIEDSMPGVKVVYTRKEDRFVELYQRAKIANDSKANLFISIHCNAHTTPALSGSETYVMGLHKSKANLGVSKRENDALKWEKDYKTNGKYADYDPNSPEAHIMLSLYQNAYLKQSINLADKIQKKVRAKGKLLDLGVKQAGFVVLWKTTMPSVLIETGYLSNPKNESYLTTNTGKLETAKNIFEAIRDYKKEVETTN